MMMEAFHNRFPQIAENETRCIIVPNNSDIKLPSGEYFFTESFCNDINCDCRRAFINVIYNEEMITTIGYGWEDLDFYKKWSRNSNRIYDIKGPILEITGSQTKYSEAILDLFKNLLLTDYVFINRLKEHYQLFKSSLKKKKIDRNESCHCGSGIKYKKCCLKNDETKKSNY